METLIIPSVEETLEFLQAKVADGHVLCGLSQTNLSEIEPQAPTMREHDSKTDEQLSEGPCSLWTDEPQKEIFRAAYVAPFSHMRRHPAYGGTLGAGIGWEGLTAANREFTGYEYEGTEALQQQVGARTAAGKFSAVYFAPLEGLDAEWREGMHDWIVRNKLVIPAGSVAVSGAHFTSARLPYRGYVRPQ